MCATCVDGFSKVAGRCFECPGFDWKTLAIIVLVNFLSALFLLHKSTSATISKPELEKIWHKVDLYHANELGPNGVQKVLTLMGASLPENKLIETLKKEYNAHVRAETAIASTSHTAQEELPVQNLSDDEDNEGKPTDDKKTYVTDQGLVVSKDSFINVRSKHSPSAAMGTAIFFVQTFGLLAKDASFFGMGEIFNLDVEEAAGRCLSPLSYSQRYFSKTVLTPVILCVGLLVSIPIWNSIRNLLKDKVHKSPPVIERIHVRRALVNTFLFCFAPLTRSSVEALVCINTCTDSDSKCVPVLMADMAVQCFAGEHIYAAAFAALVLISVALVIPSLLLRMVRRSRRRRDASLSLRVDQVDQWFDELDEDNSGMLEASEVKVLLTRMGEATDEVTRWRFAASLDPEGAGAVSKEQFEQWYSLQVTSLVSTSFDVLYGTTRSGAYWWFMQQMWLKTLINMLYTFGIANQFDWHVWMHTLLAVSVILMVNQHPYISPLDQQVELFALLSLAAVAHVSSIFKLGVNWDSAYLGLTVMLFMIPILTFVCGTVYLKRKAKKNEKLPSNGKVAVVQMVGKPEGTSGSKTTEHKGNERHLRRVATAAAFTSEASALATIDAAATTTCSGDNQETKTEHEATRAKLEQRAEERRLKRLAMTGGEG